jgi:hypothetical protein
MTEDITADIKKIIKKSILMTFGLTSVVSTIGLYRFFSEEAKTLEGQSGVGVFSLFNIFIAIIISLIMLVTLNVSRISIYNSKVRLLIWYFLPIFLIVCLSLIPVNRVDKSYILLFVTIPYFIIWTTCYVVLYRRIIKDV